MTKSQINYAAITGVVFMLGSCCIYAQAPTPVPTPVSDQTLRNQTSPTPAGFQERYPRYVIQRQDSLQLTFPRSPEFNQTVRVQPDGYVNLQNANSIHVQGLTVPEMIVALQTAYAHVLHDPIINVDLLDFQKPFFTVSGQVGKPGQYELRADITVAEALAVAGGMTPTAKTQVFLFHRTSTDWFAVRQVNMKEILQGKNVNEDAVLKPGDMIYVPEKFITKFRKYVPYSLNAGSYISQY